MSLIVRPRNAASAASLATNALAGAAGMLAGGLYRKAQNKVADIAMNGASKLLSSVVNNTTKSVATAQTRRRKNKVNSNPSNLNLAAQDFAPTALFSGGPRITFGVSGRAQKNVDQGDNGIRITGSDIFPWSVESSGASNSAFRLNGAGSTVNVVYLDPPAVSARLETFSKMYTFYAFRRLRFWYMPIVGTSTGGAVALSITSDLYSNQASNTLAKVLANQHSTITEVWRPASVEIVNRGFKVYSPYTSNSVPQGDRYQFELDGCFSGVLAAAVYGVLFVEYEIDFYSPQFSHSDFTQSVRPSTSVISSVPINESKEVSQPCDKDESKGVHLGNNWSDTATNSYAQNGTGANCPVDPHITYIRPFSNGSGENSNLDGGYFIPANGTGNNPAGVPPLLNRSCARPPIGSNGH